MPRWPKRKPRANVDEYGRTALWYFALNGDSDGIMKEIANGVDPSAGDDVGYTPLHASVQGGHCSTVRTLLDAGANPNSIDKHGNGPLWTAVLSAPNEKQVELITMLLAAGADPNYENQSGSTPKRVAFEIGHGVEVPFKEHN